MNIKVKQFLEYTGIIGSVISAVAYMVMTYVIVVGFASSVDMQKQILFAILGSLVGLVITFLLRSQGIIFASKEPESQKVMQEYHKKINKKKTVKQLHTIKHFVVWSTIKDIFSKGASIGVSTWFVLYIFMEGNGDYSLFMLAISNILMFAGFGLVAMAKSYDKYIDEHIPVIKELIQKLNDEVTSISLKEKEHANVSKHEVSITSTTSGEEPIGLNHNQRLSPNFRSESLFNI